MQTQLLSELAATGENVLNNYPVNLDYFSFFTGVFTALLGVLVTIIYEKRKSTQAEKNSLIAIIHELQTNHEINEDNISIIKQELSALNEDKIIVWPAVTLNCDFSSFLLVNCPSVFKKNANLLITIRQIIKLTKKINETINSRENYRNNNGTTNNFTARIKIYDNLLMSMLMELREVLPTVIHEMEKSLNNNFLGKIFLKIQFLKK